MMKKKVKSQEKEVQNINSKSTDIKDNTTEQENPSVTSSGTSPSEKSSETSTAGKTETSIDTDKVETNISESEVKLAEMQDKYIRLSAEFDNYRKRTLREKIDMSKYASENLLLNIIPLMDDFERALKHMEDTTDCQAMKNGIDLIYGKFSEFLKQNGVKEIESAGCSFNVDLHEAVAKTPVTEDSKKGKVVDVVMKGYYLQDKVLRFSKVVIGE